MKRSKKAVTRTQWIIAAALIIIVIVAGFVAWYTLRPEEEHVKLKVLHSQYAGVHDLFVELGTEYNELHPNIELDIERVAYADVPIKMSAAIAAGEPYDLANLMPEELWRMQVEGSILPITDLYNDIVETYGTNGEYFTNKAVKVDGEIWVIPHDHLAPLHMMYRKDILEAKGFRIPENVWDTYTWDELLEIAEACTEDTDGDGNVDRWGSFPIPLKLYSFYQVVPISMMITNGGHLIDEQGNVVFNSPQNIEVMELFKELWKYTPPGMVEMDIADLRSLFLEGKVVFTWYSTFVWPTDIEEVAPELNGKVGVASIPVPTLDFSKLPEGHPVSRCIGLGNGWVVLKDSKHSEEAKEFLKWFVQPKNYVEIPLAQPGWVPTVPQAYEEPYASKYKEALGKYYDMWIEYSELGEYPRARDPSIEENKGIYNSDSGLILGNWYPMKCMMDILLEDMPVETAVAKWHNEMVELLKE